MRRFVPIVSTIALLGAALVALPTAPAGADNGLTISPAIGANVGGFYTKVTVTGPGIVAGTTVSMTNCAKAGAPPLRDVVAGSGSLTVMVGPFVAGNCDLNIVNGTTVTKAGTYSVGGDVWFVSPVGLVPSLLPNVGDASFMVTANVANTAAPSASKAGDPNGLAGATGATLTCGNTSVPATVSILNSQQATIVPNPVTLKTVPAGTACGVRVTLASGNTFDSTALNPAGVWVDTAVPQVTVSPDSGPAGQDPAVLPKIQAVTITGAGLDTATAVNFAFCPSTNPTALNPAVIVSRTQGGGSLSVQVPNVPISTNPPCAVEAVLPSAGSRPAGYTVASVPKAKPGGGFTGGFSFEAPYQGPITFTVGNPHNTPPPLSKAAPAPRSGVTDADLHVCLVGTPSGPNVAPSFPNVNVKTLTCTAFTDLPAYSSTTHTATFTISAVLASGVIYFADQDISGNAPDARTSKARFGIFELTYDTGGVHSDMTLIDQVGFTMSSEYYPNPSLSKEPFKGSYRDTGCLVDIVNQVSLTGATMISTTTTPGVMKYSGAAPTTTPTPGTWKASDLGPGTGWIGLIGASKLTTAYPSVQTYTSSVTGPLSITDHLGNDPSFSGDFAYTATLSGGVWTLTGTIKNGTLPGPAIQVEAAGLYGPGTHGGTGYGVYGQDGPFNVQLPGASTWLGWGSGAQVTPVQPAPPADPLPDYTNLVKTIYRDFVVGFAYGYWGSSKVTGGGSATGPNAVNFTQDPIGNAYQAAQPAYPKGTGASSQYAWNVYDDVIRSLSNKDGATGPLGKPSGAYGMPYSDTFVPSALSPEGGQANIYAWTITLGDPAGCDTQATLTPPRQTVQSVLGRPVVPLKAGTLGAGSGLSEMVEYTATGFSGPVTYTLTHLDGSPVLLPAGLSFHRSTGVISGTPKASMAPVPLVVTGTDGVTSATARLTFGVGSRVITPSLQSVAGRVGAAITPTTAYTAQRFASTPRYSVSPALPKGLTIDPRTGVISGTPTVAQPVSTYLVTATGADGVAQANVTIEVDVAWTIAPATQALSGTVGQPLSGAQPYATTGFTTAPVYSVSPALPAGLSIDPATGLISGTPTTPVATSSYQVTATGTGGREFASVTLTVEPATRRLLPAQQDAVWQAGTYGASVPLNWSGFSGPVTMSLSPSTLPTGLSFNSASGVISGTPTQAAASTTYTVTARGATSQATASINVTVLPAPAPQPDLGWCSPASQTVTGTVGSPLSTSPMTIGAPAPVYVLANGSPALPAGLSGPGYSTGVISGTPTASGTTTVQIHCQGQSGYQAFASVTFVIANG